MPGIKKFIENVMGVAPRDTVNPDEVLSPLLMSCLGLSVAPGTCE